MNMRYIPPARQTLPPQQQSSLLQELLAELPRQVPVACTMLIDTDGHVRGSWTMNPFQDWLVIGPLIAAKLVASSTMSELLGGAESRMLVQEFDHAVVLVTAVSRRTMLLVIVEEQTRLGPVRLAMRRLCQELRRCGADV